MALVDSQNYRNLVTGKIESGTPSQGTNGSENSYMRWRFEELVDNKFLSIELKTTTFIQPDYLAYIGFGLGWLYNVPVNTVFKSHSCRTALGIKNIEYEYTAGNEQRHVFNLDGRRFLKSVLFPTANPDIISAGMIEFQKGSEIDASSVAFMFSSVKITNTRPEDAFKTYQIKQDRIAQGLGLDFNKNSCYIKQSPGTFSGASSAHPAGTMAAPLASGADYSIGVNAPLADSYLTDFAWVWKINTPDVSNGYQHILISKNGSTTKATPYYSSGSAYPDDIVGTGSEYRPDTMKWQDYIGNNDTAGTQARDIEILRTDMMCQVNGTRVWLGDSATLSTCTHITPLIPLLFENTTRWHFNLWKGSISTYSGCHIFILDDEFNIINTAPLGN